MKSFNNLVAIVLKENFPWFLWKDGSRYYVLVMVLFLIKFFGKADFEILISLNMNLDSLVKNLSFSGCQFF
jgi:hypothetical protein